MNEVPPSVCCTLVRIGAGIHGHESGFLNVSDSWPALELPEQFYPRIGAPSGDSLLPTHRLE